MRRTGAWRPWAPPGLRLRPRRRASWRRAGRTGGAPPRQPGYFEFAQLDDQVARGEPEAVRLGSPSIASTGHLARLRIMTSRPAGQTLVIVTEAAGRCRFAASEVRRASTAKGSEMGVPVYSLAERNRPWALAAGSWRLRKSRRWSPTASRVQDARNTTSSGSQQRADWRQLTQPAQRASSTKKGIFNP